MVKRLLLLGLVLMLGACSTTPVVAPSQFPTPVLRKVPVAMGLYMDPGLRSYVHKDKPVKGPSQDVAVGGASQTLFTEFLTAQFASLQRLPQAPADNAPAPGVEAVLQPLIQEVQIASPRTDKDEFYEAWIKYRLRLLTPQGRELTSWDLAAYGKNRGGGAMSSGNAGLTAAVQEAMRDAAAGMALIFRDGPGFRARLLASTTAATPPGAVQAAPAGESQPAPLPPAPAPASASKKLPPQNPQKSGPVIFGPEPGSSGRGMGTRFP